MIVNRKRPAIFGVDETYLIKQGVFGVLFGFCVVSAVIFFALRTDQNEFVAALDTWRSWIIQFLCIFSAVVLGPLSYLIMGIKGIVEGLSISKRKKKWLREAHCVEASIVDRKMEYNDYAETREEMWDCRFGLRLPEVIDNWPDLEIVWVSVSEKVFDKYAGQDKVVIYYSGLKPGEFVIEGEAVG